MKKINKIKQPLVSVVMPVYNAGEYLNECVNSILNQTYGNLEFIIVDDCSTDNSWEILNRMKKSDSRIKLLKMKKNSGVSMTVKLAIEKAKGNFLARMDADDIAHPQRLEKQVAYLLNNKDTVALGTQCRVINKNGKVTGKKTFPTKFEEIYKYIFTFIPLQQPSLMINRTKLPKNFEYYYDGMNTAEEVELIFKLFKFGKVENLDEKLHDYRIHDNNTSLKNLKKTFYLTLISRMIAVIKYGYRPTFQGLVATFGQALVVLLLPSRMILSLYWLLKQVKYKQKKLKSYSKSKKISPLFRPLINVFF